MVAVRLLLRRWRPDAGLLGVVIVVVALTAGLVGAVPRLLDRLALASLDDAVASVTVDRSGLAASTIRPVGGRDAATVVGELEETARALDDDLDPALRAALVSPDTLMETVRYDLAPLPGEAADGLDRKLTLRAQPGAPVLAVTRGRLPDGDVDEITLGTGTEADTGRATTTYARHEFVATAATAAALDLEVGERRLAVPDVSGPVLRRVRVTDAGPVVVELAGIVELAPPDDPYWFGDPRLHRPSQFDTNSGTTIFATGLVTEAALQELPGVRDGQVAEVTVRWGVDRDGLLASDLDRVQQAAVAVRTQPSLLLDQPTWSTGLDRLLATEAARRATAVEVLGLAAVGVTGVAVALLLAVGGVLAQRRRDHLALVRGRGASRLQLAAAAVVEFGAVTAIGLVVAVAALAVTLPGTSAWWLPPVVAVLAAVVLVGGALRDARRRLGALLAERGRPPPVRPRRHVLDGLLVLVAAVAVTSLRRRGVALDGSVDPLVIAAPVLLAAAAAVVAARLAPLPLRAAAAAARRWRGLAVSVGLARAARSPGEATLVVLLVLGIGVAGLAAAVHRSLAAGHAQAADERVGADVRIDAPPLSTLDPSWEPPGGGDRVATLRELSQVPLVADFLAQRVDVVLVDPVEVAALDVGGELPDLTWDGVGVAPAIASDDLAAVGSPAPGDDLTLSVDRDAAVVVELAAVVPQVLGRDGEDGTFVVVDAAAVEAAAPVDTGVTTRLVATDDPAAVVAAARSADPEAEVRVREEVEAALRAAPLARGVRLGFLVAAIAAVVTTTVALVLALVALAPRRRRDAAVLGALGTSRRGIRIALLAEVLPVVAGAAATGIVLAAAVALLVGERLDLRAFAGTAGPTQFGLPPWWVAATSVVGAVVVAGVAAVLAQGRVDSGALLREGD